MLVSDPYLTKDLYMNSRRDFFRKALFTLAALPLVKVADAVASACPTAAPTSAAIKKKLLDFSSSTAKRLDFVANSVDASKHAKFKAGSSCGNCKFYKADKGEPTYGKCSMVANKYVPNCGWCKSYRKA